MKRKIDESRKVTLTIGQLRKLVRESKASSRRHVSESMSENATFDNIEVGDILFDETNSEYGITHDFYKVAKKIGTSTVELTRMDKKRTYDLTYASGTEVPSDEKGTVKVRFNDKGARADRYASRLKKWDGRPLEWCNMS